MKHLQWNILGIVTFIFCMLSAVAYAQTGNTTLGTSAGGSITTGDYNTFTGHYAGYKATTASYNTFVGKSSGYNTLNGGFNTFVGWGSGYNNTAGQQNTFLGMYAGLNNSTGSQNIFIGSYTGGSNTSASYNTFIGDNSGYNHSTGNTNVFLGYNAGYSNATGQSNVFIGPNAGYSETGSNKLYIANASGTPLIYGDFSTKRVGLGTSAPNANLHVSSGATGDAVLHLEADTDNAGSENDNPLIKLSQDGGNVAINMGFENTQFGPNIFGIGRKYNATVDWKVFRIDTKDGRVAIGDVSTAPNGYKLYVEDGILTERVKVALKNSSDWADYVFDEDYELKSLNEVETHIQKNGYLHNTPSAQQLVTEGGVELGEITVNQQEKIEEIFLHLIEMDKRIKQLEAENARLKAMNNE